ncbi:MAG: PLDc N-terminal domain-containing protein [Actinomycetes bacterium]
MLRVLIILLPIALAIYALVDLVQTDDEDVQGLPKLAWVVLIVLIGVVGPLAWLIAGKRGRRFLPGLLPKLSGPAGPAAGRPVAPDDDPDFLRGLGRPRTPPPLPPPVDEGPDGDEDNRDDRGPDDPPLASR